MLTPDYHINLFETAREAIGSWKDLAKYLTIILDRKIFVQHFKRWRTGKQKCKKGIVDSFVPLDIIIALSGMLSKKNPKFGYSEIKKHLLCIRNKKGRYHIWFPRFPISLDNPSVAAVVGHVLHDGWVGKEFQTTYYGIEPENIAHFKESVPKMFGGRVEFYEKVVNGVTRVMCPTVVGYLLVFLGIRPGNKVKNDVSPPDWLFSCKKETIQAYLRAFVSDEASVKVPGNGGGSIRVKLASRNNARPSKLIQANWKLLKMVGINPAPLRLELTRATKHGEIRTYWRIIIQGRKNFEIFRDKIGFEPKHKQVRLTRILTGYRYPSDYVSLRDDFRMNFFKSAFKLVGGITSYNCWLESKLKRKIHLASIYDWYAGRYSVPLEVVGATAVLLNSKSIKCSLVDIRANIIGYRPNRNHLERTISRQTLADVLEKLGFKIL